MFFAMSAECMTSEDKTLPIQKKMVLQILESEVKFLSFNLEFFVLPAELFPTWSTMAKNQNV